MAKFKQGFFKPKNPQKYKGNPTNIEYRSSWEFKLMMYLDSNPHVIWWSSEEHAIPYRSPKDGRIHRYFPDFIVKINKQGTTETLMIEIKPKSQTVEPVRGSKTNKKFINEIFTWGINQAKWKSAEEYCKDRGWKFVIFTETELGIK